MKGCPQKLLEKKDNISKEKVVGSALKLYARWLFTLNMSRDT